MCYSKYFICANWFNPHNNPMMQELILSLFYIWSNWGTEELILFAQGSWGRRGQSQVVNLHEPGSLAVESMLLIILLLCLSQEWPRTPNDGPGSPSAFNSQRLLLGSSCLSLVPIHVPGSLLTVSFAGDTHIPSGLCSNWNCSLLVCYYCSWGSS